VANTQSTQIKNSHRDPHTPAEVEITLEAREPVSDPTLGIPVTQVPSPQGTHRLVVVGDSLSHGFQSGAIYNTDISYPAIIAWEMGWFDSFRFPTYYGFGGLPLNLEFLIRALEEKIGGPLNARDLLLAYLDARHHLAMAEDWWERGGGSAEPNLKYIIHNQSMYGWDLRDALSFTAQVARQRIKNPKDNFFVPLIANASERAVLRVLPNLPPQDNLSTLDAAAALGNEGDGIETLVIMLGSNNALGTVVQLKVEWSKWPDCQDLDKKDAFTVWNPEHFQTELNAVEARVKTIRAKRVIWATVPHVTIPPITRGIGKKVRSGSRYFPYYTRPWINDQDFDPTVDPRLTENQARAIDSAIDQYNYAIVDVVKRARSANPPKDWYLFDMAGLLDRLASRRYLDDPSTKPSWWTTPYQLPPALKALDPLPDSHFFTSGPSGRETGGLFALDGVHPTTIGYGLIAQEIIKIMQLAGVAFFQPDGKTVRPHPIDVDFDRLIHHDTLISHPPVSLDSDLALLGWLNEKLDFFRRLV
jgi:hypothetical protein